MARRLAILVILLALWAVSALAQGAIHIVRHGETVFGIVTRTYGCPASAVEQVARDNRLVNYRIFPGQALRINCAGATAPTGVAGDFGIVLLNAPRSSSVTIVALPANPASPRPIAGATPAPVPTSAASAGLSLADMQALLALRGFSPRTQVWCDSPSVLSDPTRPQLTPQLFDTIPTQICPPGLVAIVAKNLDIHIAVFGQAPLER
ncbi:MAG: LysM peptidoglycan-binding domain-containing protein [Anaerolineae bacterium]|nr:LysM peptidoglycan-binding domain-containing protein [Anaerolineae bacterium]MDW8171609.1 LysM domain-containing protein [Anaerolineae bacterium]